MDREAARRLALDEMNKYGFGVADGWRFQFSRSARMAGDCNLMTQTIRLSGRFVDVNGRAEVLDTIRHEIAHAYAGWKGASERNAGHGPIWKYHARLLGARPERCIPAGEAVLVPFKWVAICPTHGRLPGGKRRRSDSMEYGVQICRKCRSPVHWVDMGAEQIAVLKKS